MLDITAGFGVVMKRYGVSSNELAKKRGVSNRAINKAIGSEAVKKLDVICSYCESIGCTVSELVVEAEIAFKKKQGE